jgi:hypothetical protein
MTILKDQLLETLLPGMYFPEPLELLYSWIEENGFFVDNENGRIGCLFSREKLKSEWTKTERTGGTDIIFVAEGNRDLKYWFGHEKPEVLNRLCVFAKTGADGSMAAFWLDDHGKQKIVHLGSGSGSTLVCVLAENALDFLRLIAIGYDEICWSETFSQPPNDQLSDRDFFVHPNVEYQNWVKTTFGVKIPETAGEIVKHPAKMETPDLNDPFFFWVDRNVA